MIGSSASVEKLTCNSLSKYLIDCRHGKVAETEDETKLMLKLAEEYSTFEDVVGKTDLQEGLDSSKSSPSSGQVVASAAYRFPLLATNVLRCRFSPEPPELSALIFSTNSARRMTFRKSYA